MMLIQPIGSTLSNLRYDAKPKHQNLHEVMPDLIAS